MNEPTTLSQPTSLSQPTTLVVGTGLIGTSAALALAAAGRPVLLVDPDRRQLDVAVAKGAGSVWSGERVDHVVLGVPAAATAEVLRDVLHLHVDATVSDVASVKSAAALDVETNTPGLARFAGGHPLAGSERGGARAARADLFAGRPWAVTAYPWSSPHAVAAATAVAVDCGAVPVVLDPDEHDAAVALTSHLPQLVASALAATVGTHLSPAVLAVVGQGLRDTTRIAASPPDLWGDILRRNASLVAPLAVELSRRLETAAEALRGEGGEQAARELVALGNAAVAELPGKHSAHQQPVEVVHVLLRDVPGALAALLTAAHGAGVNVEDIRIEHAPGAAVGSAGLVVLAGSGDVLAEALEAAGWSATVEPAAGPR